MYLGDPREQQIDLDNHTIWEENNRKEERYQWGALVLDLCDMDPKEYAQTIFHTEGTTPPSPTPTTKNNMGIEFNGGDYSINFSYAPTSELVIVLKDTDGNEMVINIPAGTSSPVTGAITDINPNKVNGSFIGPSYEQATSNTYSDDTYTYFVYVETTSNNLVKYVYMKHTDVEAGLTEESLINAGLADAAMADKDATFTYVIKPVEIPGFNDMDEDEYNAILREQQLDLLILSTSNVVKIYLNENEEQTSSWNRNYATISIDGSNYLISRYLDSQLVNICDTNYETPSDIDFNYKVTIQ